MTDLLHTLAGDCRHQQDVRKSRFLAQASSVESAEQALAFVAAVSDPTATHNCWAYRMTPDYRFQDDGEPGGTAGRPILQAIEGQGLDRTVVVVTRWYGGIKLGAGGLARAYGGTAAECLRVAARVPLVVMTRLRLHCEFADLTLLKSRLRDFDAQVDNERFDSAGVIVELCLPAARADEATARITDLTRGRSVPYRSG